MKDLVDLKEMYPDRVHLILGNRDINKLRIQSSMHPSVLATLPSVYWLRATPEETTGPQYKLNDPEDKMKWVRCVDCTSSENNTHNLTIRFLLFVDSW